MRPRIGVSPPKVPSRPPPPLAASPAPPQVAPAAKVPAVAPVPVETPRVELPNSDTPPPDDAWGDPPAPPAAAAAPAAPPPAPTAAQREAARLSNEMRHEVKSLVRAQVEEAVAPVARAVGDLRAQLESDRRERSEAPPPMAGAPPVNPPPLKKPTFGSVVPAAVSPWTETPLGPPVQLTPPADLDATPAISPAVVQSASNAAYPSIPVSMAPSVAPAAPRVIDLEPGLYVDIPGALDGSRRRKRLGIFVGFLVLLLVGGMLTAMIVSRS